MGAHHSPGQGTTPPTRKGSPAMNIQSPYEAVELPPSDAPGSPGWLEWVINWALLSPSPHNTQPWRWRVEGTTIQLRADRSRQLSVCDPECRELTIGCGSALEHLLIALGSYNLSADVCLLPRAADPDALADVVVGAGAPLPGGSRLFAQLAARRTHRGVYSDQPVDAPAIEALLGGVAGKGVHAHIARGDHRAAVCQLVETGDRTQMHDGAFRRELSSWMRPALGRHVDGMPSDLLGQHGLAAEVAPLAVRLFDMGGSQAARDAALLEGSPVIAVVWSERDEPLSWLETGRFFARLVLTAQADGVVSAHMNQPCELPELRPRLASLLGIDGHPQLVLRFGNAPPVHSSVRRPLAEVLDSH